MTKMTKTEEEKKRDRLIKIIEEEIDWNYFKIGIKQHSNVIAVFYSGIIIWPLDDVKKPQAFLHINTPEDELQIRAIMRIVLTKDLDAFPTANLTAFKKAFDCIRENGWKVDDSEDSYAHFMSRYRSRQTPAFMEMLEIVQDHINNSNPPPEIQTLSAEEQERAKLGSY